MPHAMLDPSIRHITIIGPGLLGGSIGLGLRERGFDGRIVGVARKPQTRDAAVQRGCIDEAFETLVPACADADLVVIATPVGTVARILEHLDPLVSDEAVITDVGSTKASIVAAADRLLGRPQRFVGSHPMAGMEATGPEAARADLYRGRPVILTPGEHTDPVALRHVEQLWRTLGMRIVRLTPEEHDRAVATVSHLPHALAVLLMELAPRSGGLHIASSGLESMTRLAGGDVTMWADIFVDNAEAVAEALEAYEDHLKAFRDMVASGDRDAIVETLAAARETRRRWLADREDEEGAAS